MFTELGLALPKAVGCSRNTVPNAGGLPAAHHNGHPGTRLQTDFGHWGRRWPSLPPVIPGPQAHARTSCPPPCRTSVTSLSLRARVCPHLHMAEWGVLTVLGV